MPAWSDCPIGAGAARALVRLLPLSLILTAAAAGPARGNPFDTYGYGSRAIALGGAATAAAADADAVYYNPAALARVRALAVSLGVLVADDFLEQDDHPVDLPATMLVEIGLAAPLPLGRALKDRLFVGVALALPTTELLDVEQPDDEAVWFPFWGGRNRRLVLATTFAGRITDWLSVGAGFSLLASVSGQVAVDVEGSGENAIDVSSAYDVAALAGLLVEPLPWLALGVTYRGAQHATIDLPVNVQVAAGVPPVHARVTAPAFALPHEVALGAALRPLAGLTVALDVTWYDYSAFRYGSPDIAVYDDAGAVVREFRATPQRFRDVWAPRGGVEWFPASWLALRGGYAWVPSPVPAQTGRTNLLDADRHVVGLGVGLDLTEDDLWEGARRLAIDLHGQVAFLQRREFAKAEFLPENPGWPTVTVSGGAFSVGLSVRLWL